MYDESDFPVANTLHRYTPSRRDTLEANPDGSIDLHVRHASPGKANEAS